MRKQLTDKVIILGAGLAGISLANFLKKDSIILEKEKNIGGLCRSFEFQKVFYDVGPHILFSKNKKVLNLITSWASTNKIKRSNKIVLNGKIVKYPLENDLAGLREQDREYCLKEFLDNPYKGYKAKNMLQFFLKIFGEGITKLYLQPYNEKIWKFDLCSMGTEMVYKIPIPPKEDIIKSAKGINTEGYKHQLYFSYPKKRGIQTIIENLNQKNKLKSEIIKSVEIMRIEKKGGIWEVKTNIGAFKSKTLVSCIPIHELFKYINAPKKILKVVDKLKYNSIYITAVEAIKDNIGNNFAFYVPDKNIIFHRLSKINFLGKNYFPKNGSSIILTETTYRSGSLLSSMSEDEIKEKVAEGLEKLGFVKRKDILKMSCQSFNYAYVIYDLNHRKNVDCVLKYLKKIGIRCCGRFAEFEYLNMDQVVEHSQKLAQKLNLKI